MKWCPPKGALPVGEMSGKRIRKKKVYGEEFENEIETPGEQKKQGDEMKGKKKEHEEKQKSQEEKQKSAEEKQKAREEKQKAQEEKQKAREEKKKEQDRKKKEREEKQKEQDRKKKEREEKQQEKETEQKNIFLKSLQQHCSSAEKDVSHVDLSDISFSDDNDNLYAEHKDLSSIYDDSPCFDDNDSSVLASVENLVKDSSSSTDTSPHKVKTPQKQSTNTKKKHPTKGGKAPRASFQGLLYSPKSKSPNKQV